ncbi:MAG: hypothetical protein SOV58_05920, partial [Candidatus Enteromonas sp.]|nr:hypothetical protein [Candidatus Enteromonas sp.]
MASSFSYTDGKRDLIVTDESWDWSNDGPILFADNKDGEVVNASQEPSYGGKAKATNHPVIPAASNNVSVTEHERFTPTVTKSPNGNRISLVNGFFLFVAFLFSGASKRGIIKMSFKTLVFCYTIYRRTSRC